MPARARAKSALATVKTLHVAATMSFKMRLANPAVHYGPLACSKDF